MNPVMMQQVSRSDRHDHARQLEEIRLLNQAYPRRSQATTADSRPKNALLALLPAVARRLRAWVGGGEQALAAENRS